MPARRGLTRSPRRPAARRRRTARSRPACRAGLCARASMAHGARHAGRAAAQHRLAERQGRPFGRRTGPACAGRAPSRGRCRRSPRCPGVVEDHEGAAAEARALRLDQAQHRLHGHRGVHRRAAARAAPSAPPRPPADWPPRRRGRAPARPPPPRPAPSPLRSPAGALAHPASVRAATAVPARMSEILRRGVDEGMENARTLGLLPGSERGSCLEPQDREAKPAFSLDIFREPSCQPPTHPLDSRPARKAVRARSSAG